MNLPAPALVALALLAAAVRAEPEFTGVLATSSGTLFALRDPAIPRTDWVALQGRFADWVVAAYDRPTDTLTLTRAGESRRIRLKDGAPVQPARLELAGEISFGSGEKLRVERATLAYDQENAFPLKEGLVYRITPTRRPDGNLQYRILLEQTGPGNRVERVSAPSVVTRPGDQFSLRVGDHEIHFKPLAP
ncbi:MAG: hypothetical protein HZC55_24700 [Verrucomicrobia bacterium]|nr:hypothetical protein [Verrucomicrobiota bacterium]